MAEEKLILVHTDHYNDQLWINAANIETVERCKDSNGVYTLVTMMNGKTHPVQETPEQIQAKIAA